MRTPNDDDLTDSILLILVIVILAFMCFSLPVHAATTMLPTQ